jgi:2-polyprenyl-3-methyl-5-hydroxy-6-metoxy-1,4-benzoquinol methylase
MTLWHCEACDFDFFDHDPTRSLETNKLDESRLKAAGLDIPARDKDFANGIEQSRGYVDEYLEAGDAGRNVLEIGCSWGYFLKLAREAGARPYGIELNALRADHVNANLDIPCDTSLEACEARGIRFHKIFLFYVLEYVPNPVAYLRRLVSLLDDGGAIVLVTPSLADPLKDLWKNEAFGRFFYDEHAINYMTPQSVHRLVRVLAASNTEVTTRQGYSFVNHVSWYLTNAPRTTGVVGGDNFIRDIVATVRQGKPRDQRSDEASRNTGVELADLMSRFDEEYRRLLQARDYGNQIRVVVWR